MNHLKKILLLALILGNTQAFAFGWNDLWYNRNQQGQQLMNKGQFKKAQDYFSQQDWSATAAYRSGNYPKAAKEFMDLDSENGFYNAGNALAHQGQYEQAIEAYNKALALNPDNADARFNRNLVAELLKKQQEKQQQSNQDQQQNKDKEQNQNKKQQNQDNQQEQNQQQDQQQNQSQQEKQKSSQEKDKDKKESQEIKQQENKKQEAQKSDAANEKQHAQEQWLQLVPDDPGGLLREKFLRDYIRRQHGW